MDRGDGAATRLPALGRKNWMLAGSDAGGQRAVCIYTIVETAKMHGLNPQAYRADILGRIADHPSRQLDAGSVKNLGQPACLPRADQPG